MEHTPRRERDGSLLFLMKGVRIRFSIFCGGAEGAAVSLPFVGERKWECVFLSTGCEESVDALLSRVGEGI